jgi:hypothetical protein
MATKPLEVEELSMDELEELPAEGGASARPGHSVVEVPVVLDKSLFSGAGPVEIQLKLYLK